MPIRKKVKEQLRKAIEWAMETEIPFTESKKTKHTPKPISIRIQTKQPMEIPNLKGPDQTRLVLSSLLHIHDSIIDAEALQGYEGTPDQIDKMRWEVYGILAKNPEVTTTQEVHDIWLDDYATAELQEEMGWVPEDERTQEENDLLKPTDYTQHQIKVVEDKDE